MNISKNIIRAGIYIRCSTDDQKMGFGLQVQEEKLKAFVVSQDYKLDVKHIYRDEGFSGTLPVKERPALSNLFDAVRAGEVDVILVYRLDRLFRKTRLLLEALEELNNHGVGFRSITESFDTTNVTGRFMTTLLGAVAEMERDTIKERTTNGRLAAARAGRWPTGVPAYGYRLNKKTKKLTINKREAKVVEMLFDLLIDEKHSLRKITSRINSQNIPTPSHGKRKAKTLNTWHTRTIGRILTNDIYTGVFSFRKYKRPFNNLTSLVDSNLQRDESEWIKIEVPQIISKDKFEAAKNQLLSNREFAVRNLKRSYMFSKLVYCGDCGFKLFGGFQPPRKEGLNGSKYYHGVFRDKSVNDTKRCERCFQIAETRLYPIWEELKVLLIDPQRTLKQIQRKIDKKVDRELVLTQISHIDKQLKSLTIKRHRIAQIYSEDETMGFNSYQKALNECRSLEENLRNKRGKLNQSLFSNREIGDRADRINDMSKNLLEKLDCVTYEQKQEIIRLFVNKVIVYSKTNKAEVELNLSECSQKTSYYNGMIGKESVLWDNSVRRVCRI